MSLRPRIPATIVTGFLGAGKTTLLRHLLAMRDGRRLALIINEFGDLGIDRELLLGCGDEACAQGDIVELANGCICCTVADDFLPTIEALLDRPEPPDHIVIETSGLALPKPLVKAFDWPEVRARVTVDGVIAVVDAAAAASGSLPTSRLNRDAAMPTTDRRTRSRSCSRTSCACADLVVLNKTDLLDARRLRSLSRDSAKRAAPGREAGADAAAARSSPSRARPRRRGGGRSAAAGRSHIDAARRARPRRFRQLRRRARRGRRPAGADRARLRAAIAPSTTSCGSRASVDVPGKAMRLVVQGSAPRIEHYFDRPWRRRREARRGALVVIGRKGLDRARIESPLGAAPDCMHLLAAQRRATSPTATRPSISARRRRDIVVLSAADSEIALLAASRARAVAADGAGFPRLRLANLLRLSAITCRSTSMSSR